MLLRSFFTIVKGEGMVDCSFAVLAANLVHRHAIERKPPSDQCRELFELGSLHLVYRIALPVDRIDQCNLVRFSRTVFVSLKRSKHDFCTLSNRRHLWSLCWQCAQTVCRDSTEEDAKEEEQDVFSW
ncbi:hypothetical protein M513_06665 [Trichuris suis]|uniref:Uncharacterized protein n=1 Tax=Trichuris suis TaxID=68888 RepID=A0A085M5H2_9BILA|nr:hypothetical protein M513_06665 [Trichuris suis]